MKEIVTGDEGQVARCTFAALLHQLAVVKLEALLSARRLDRRNRWAGMESSNCLSLLALETGGKDYSQGLQTPINFYDIIRRLKERLGNQYLLTFRAEQVRKNSYARLHLTTEQPGIELVAPSRVYIPGTGSTTP